jgi:hypothetical protein
MTHTVETDRIEKTVVISAATVVESGFDALPAHCRADAITMNAAGWAAQLRNIEKHVGAEA